MKALIYEYAVITRTIFNRKNPLKDLSIRHVKIKQLTRQIKQLNYNANLLLPSLPVEKQKVLCKETKQAVDKLLQERRLLEQADDDQNSKKSRLEILYCKQSAIKAITNI